MQSINHLNQNHQDQKQDNKKENEKLYLMYDQEKYNGIILEKGTDKVVCRCLSKFKNINSIEEINESNQNIYEYCEDGTIIRLYNYDNKWMTATSRCIDGRYSYWTSEKSFDELFWETYGMDRNLLLDLLDDKYTYIFILLHNENRIVIEHKSNKLIYVYAINNETGDIEDENINNFERPQRVDVKIIDKLSEMNEYRKGYRGILINSGDITYKYDFPEYEVIKELRGNISMIHMRYLELINDSDKLEQFERYYSEYYFLFAVIKNALNNLVNNLYNIYIDTHIKHIAIITEDNLYYKTIKKIHSTYLNKKNEGQNNIRLSRDDIKSIVYKYNGYILRKLLKMK